MGRVTLVVNSFDEGSETFLHSLAEVLAGGGHDVTVHALTGASSRMRTGATFADGTRVTRSAALPAMASRRMPRALLTFLLHNPASAGDALLRSIRRYGLSARAARAAAALAPILASRPEAVHVAFSGIGVAVMDALDLLDADTPLVVSCRGSGELVNPVLDAPLRPELRRLFHRATAVHAVSDAVAGAATRWGADPSTIRVIRPGIDVTKFERGRERRPLGKSLRLVSVGRLHWVKAVDVQIAAVALLRTAGHDVTLELVGDGPERRALEFRSIALGVQDHIVFHGGLDSAGVRSVLESADAFVLSSLSEGTSNAVLEAMALEVPVISTPAGGMAEVVVDGVNAMVAATGDADSLARAVERIIGRPDLAEEIAGSGRRTVLGGFTLDRLRSEWSDLFVELLSKGAAASGMVQR